ncbi:diaminopimelate decarboxylase [Serratia sp. SCBI]|nr:diaminopimelate decarboxylase [Serratia sp. SCBI]
MASGDRRTIRRLVFGAEQRPANKHPGGDLQITTFGPQLARPHADTLHFSEAARQLKELRVQHRGRPFRVFFAFAPQRQAVLLCGGDKTGDKRFYQRMLPIAAMEFSHYLATRR